MRVRLRLCAAEVDVRRLVRRSLRSLAVVPHRPDDVAPHRSERDVRLVDARREPRAVPGDREAVDAGVDPLPAFLLAELLELAGHRAIALANGAQSLALECIVKEREKNGRAASHALLARRARRETWRCHTGARSR